MAPIPLSEFRKKKLHHVFEVFFDTNKNGTIDRADFDIAIHNVCFNRGWKEDTDVALGTKKRFLQIWQNLKEQAQISSDTGVVTPEEWYALWADPMNITSWQQNYMITMFELLDTTSDGVIDKMEFCSMCSCYGVDLIESIQAYMLLSKGNNVTVNQEYFKGLWHEYFYGEDTTAFGNYLFGRVNWN